MNENVLPHALREFDEHIEKDLSYSQNLHSFIAKDISEEKFLNNEFGMKKFLKDYSVARTLNGQKNKAQIVDLLINLDYSKNNYEVVQNFARGLQKNQFSTFNKISNNFIVPTSFASKFLFLYKPDRFIPYDSFVYDSLKQINKFGKADINSYYMRANEFKESLGNKIPKDIAILIDRVKEIELPFLKNINMKDLVKWRIADKYLWSDKYLRNKEKENS